MAFNRDEAEAAVEIASTAYAVGFNVLVASVDVQQPTFEGSGQLIV